MVTRKPVVQIHKTEIRPISTILGKINSKWIKDLNVTSKSTSLLEENTGDHRGQGLGTDFLRETLFAQELMSTIGKKDLMKPKNFNTVKKIIERRANTPQSRKESFPALHIYRKIYRIYKQVKTNDTTLKWAMNQN